MHELKVGQRVKPVPGAGGGTIMAVSVNRVRVAWDFIGPEELQDHDQVALLEDQRHPNQIVFEKTLDEVKKAINEFADVTMTELTSVQRDRAMVLLVKEAMRNMTTGTLVDLRHDIRRTNPALVIVDCMDERAAELNQVHADCHPEWVIDA